MKVAVCVLTYKRPDGLKRLLDGLSRQAFIKTQPSAVQVVVVDNDPAASSVACCSSLQPGYPWKLVWYNEKRRGISFARNRAVALAWEKHDFIAFIDDDEVPEPSWLDELLAVQQMTQAAIVTGPVLPVYPEGAPAWSVKSGCYERSRHPTGYALRLARTGNVLIQTEVFARIENWFDERYALSGGEDTHFFMRVKALGFDIVWADEAIVHEWLPLSRLKVSWLLQRAYRSGNTYTLCERDIRQSAAKLVIRAIKGGFRIGSGLVLALPALLLGRIAFIKALQSICLGAGMVMGLVGKRYEEYQRTHAV
ncbi:glycosyltransferase family 2 protein [Brevibacillus reuszeri]|uniref:glycosyltransferase family 2 protein n=1 Tax=Brevibacillus reuszeri TaxID=54915 RepID=UPI002898C426|nr:glycosyltransferase [Brevibacillus reuszeri]